MGTIATLERIFWFDDQARRKRYPNARALAERFELSSKTAQRCIDAMRDRFGAPLEYHPSKRGYYYLDDSLELPHFQIGQEEILSLLLARRLLSSTSGGFISRDIERFSRKLITEAGGLGLAPGDIDRIFSATWTGHAPVSAATFQLISHSLIASRRLRFAYRSPVADQPITRTVEPHHLQYYMASWVLTARCLLRGGWRKFYLSRMDALHLTDETFTPRPADQWRHCMEGAFGIFQGEKTIDVVLHFSPFRAGWIREQCWHPAQQMVPLDDGGLELRLPVADFREIKMKILQFGADVVVVAPEALRSEIVDEIGRLGKIYGEA
ncbi:WYL domain-containing protein [Desulfosarcina ovata subsp. sediminis]|uniref:WYL domain-containing protein n=1 Tax=Desulfosarcina ovata subsp. sediminis TaxID=885957 RepID=A0A5K7ZQU0_9BACT|nr:WYL domain-containing protein [Desulfosarcina ovata]BBO79953.1 WYL domain-containing protein [Desulfosarcina ovata subsp. sediminis]